MNISEHLVYMIFLESSLNYRSCVAGEIWLDIYLSTNELMDSTAEPITSLLLRV